MEITIHFGFSLDHNTFMWILYVGQIGQVNLCQEPARDMKPIDILKSLDNMHIIIEFLKSVLDITSRTCGKSMGF